MNDVAAVSEGIGSVFATRLDGLQGKGLANAAAALSSELNSRLERRGDLVDERIRRYEKAFEAAGHRCPLGPQLRGVRRTGLPGKLPLVDALLFHELTHGVLMGVQDAGPIEGGLVFSAARAGDGYRGMRGPVTCSAGEPVLRDDRGIIASVFQGPDARTHLTRRTTDVVLLAFGIGDVAPSEVSEGFEALEAFLAPFAAEPPARLIEAT